MKGDKRMPPAPTDTNINTDPSQIPAIAGGEPLCRDGFQRCPRYGDEELKLLKEALEQQTLFYAQGRMVSRMEERFCRIIGSLHAVATSSGTAAIHSALMAAGISPGDEVITSPITDMGTVVPILWQGAIPVFADVDPESCSITPDSVSAVLTPRTRAVLAVHLWGNACDLDGLARLCAERNIILIEDCAQAFGCAFRGRSVGTVGAIGCFSLNEFKHISCGDGGIAVTSDPELARRLRLATDKCYGRTAEGASRLAFFLANNYRMTELQGAVALAQMEKLEDIVARRRRWCSGLLEGLRGVPGIRLPRPTEGCDPSWWFFPMRVIPEELGCGPDEFAAALRAEGVPASARYIGQCVYEYPLFRDHSAFERGAHPFSAFDYHKGLCPEAEAWLETVVNIAINEAYTAADMDACVRAVSRVARWFAARPASA
jgi:dTDP-4-amino-4,6-dideoxygalactose transaminase